MDLPDRGREARRKELRQTHSIAAATVPPVRRSGAGLNSGLRPHLRQSGYAKRTPPTSVAKTISTPRTPWLRINAAENKAALTNRTLAPPPQRSPERKPERTDPRALPRCPHCRSRRRDAHLANFSSAGCPRK